MLLGNGVVVNAECRKEYPCLFLSVTTLKVHGILQLALNLLCNRGCVCRCGIIVGDFTYIADSDFESHVSHLYEWNDDKLIIGKFCQIAAGVEFVMNGANHQMNAVSTFPFYTLEGWEMSPPAKTDLPLKGDTVIENDVWIGQNAVILPGVHIGDGAIIGANSVVGSDVPPYTKVVGNLARAIQKRFDDELIELLLRFKWWDRSIDEINRLIPILTCSDLDKVKAEIKKQLG